MSFWMRFSAHLDCLHPLSRCEVLGGDSSFIDMLFDGDVGAYRTDRLGDKIAELVATGGYPEAHARTNDGRRKVWYWDYIETITQRDVRELTRIQGLNAIPNLLAMAAAQSVRSPVFHHFRNRDGVEVDLVLERGPDKVSAVDVKLSATVTTKDFRGLRKIQSALGNRFKSGIVLYDGEELLPFGERLWAIPLGRVWDKG